jgi:phosphoribosylformylglycinamidine synthase
MPKLGVLDPQGEALVRGLHSLGHDALVTDARVGRSMEIDLDTDDPAQARALAERMCAELLVNDVVERGEIEIIGDAHTVAVTA